MNNQQNLQPDINEFMNKIKKLEKGEKLDLSSDEDLSVAIMNLISMEEHFFFTYNKTEAVTSAKINQKTLPNRQISPPIKFFEFF